MSEQPLRHPRQIAVADHLWETYLLMSHDMGVDRESLVNQALFAFARQNGYLQPGAIRPAPAPEPIHVAAAPVATAPAMPPALAFAAAPSYGGPPTPIPLAAAAPAGYAPFGAASRQLDDVTPPSGVPAVAPLLAVTVPPLALAAPPPSAPAPHDDPSATGEEEPSPTSTVAIRAPRPFAFASMPASMPPPAPPPPVFAPPVFAPPPVSYAPPPVSYSPPSVSYSPPSVSYAPPSVIAPLPSTSAPDLGTKMSPDELRAAQERVLQKAAELERLVRGGEQDEGDNGVDDDILGSAPVVQDEEPPPAPAKKENVLVLYAEGREVDRVTGQRFLIGRGKHCDLIINSGKVSREHAAIVRESEAYFIEDLGSSNGTWFDKKRITRRKVEDGDEYFVCSEKITCRIT